MLTLTELSRQAGANGGAELDETVWAQIETLRQGRTQNDKPFFDLEIVDADGRAKFKIWSDSSAFDQCHDLQAGDFCELSGRFFVNNFGLNVSRPTLRTLADDEVEIFLQGSPAVAKLNQDNWDYMVSVFTTLQEPRLREVSLAALKSLEKKWRRAAAARTYHHARRGGLLEHTSQMLRLAVAVAPLYPEVCPDLLYCGVLFHDAGKMWENNYPKRGFVSKPNRRGELLGHISLGIEITNKYWNQTKEANSELFANTAESELVRDHLLHLIAAHHGTREFGSPVTPRTPEAWLLHHIDNIDAKMEMLRRVYVEKDEVAPGLYDRRPPLEGLTAAPLSWNLPADGDTAVKMAA
ncbi:MAG: HD domain-containing protein [Verrucomicrobiales bacterium]|jgi:3'-5' exoribonuclease|nr:HD domain-containing protein [Verrucomicrobiales bacterium]